MIKVRRVNESDLEGVYKLYIDVTTKHPTKMTQTSSEVKLDYIKNDVIGKSMKYGLMLVAEDENGNILGIFKAYTSPYKSLAHVMSNVTLMSVPNTIGTRVFVILMKEFFSILENEYKHIYKLESNPHSSNTVAIKFYLNHGLKTDAVLKNKIFNFEKNDFEDEVIVSWTNPNFDMEALKKYHLYLANCLNMVK